MELFGGYMVVFVLVVGLLIDETGAYCDVTGLTRLATCARNFQRSLGVSPGTSAFDGVSANQFRSRLETVCSTYDEVFKPCYDRYFDFCAEDVASVRAITYVHEMMNYQCHTGREGVIEHGPCWTNPVVEGKTLACVSRHMGTRALTHIIRSGDLHKLCRHAYRSLTCAGDVVYEHCGKEAAAVYSTLTSYAQLMIAQVASCPEIKNTFGSSVNNPYMIENRLPSNTIKLRRKNGKIHRSSVMPRDRSRQLTASVTPAAVIARLSGSIKHGTEKVSIREKAITRTRNWPSSSTTKPVVSFAIFGIATLMSFLIM